MFQEIIDKYYNGNAALRHILVTHSQSVAQLALQIASLHPELHIDTGFVRDAAMLHDIGIVLTNAPGIECHGTEPYIRHGVCGAEILRKEGLPEKYARVICYADKFFSKTHLDRQKTVEQAEKSLAKFGGDTIERFREMRRLFE